ncbi:hypothetical protein METBISCDRAFT_3530, partial [Metschnikowia bicuspidata]
YTSVARNNVIDTAKDILKTANKTRGEVLASAMESAEQVTPLPKMSRRQPHDRQGGVEKADEAKDKVKDGTNHAEAKMKVEKNTLGYRDLQDKGSRVESEQNRPNDAV